MALTKVNRGMSPGIDQAKDEIIDGAGTSLDTLEEISNAINNDPNFSTTVQPLNQNLTDISALTTTSFGRSLLTETSEGTLKSTLNVNALAGFRNKIINGNFDIWQRGTSHSSIGFGSADRWYLNLSGGAATLSRQEFALGQTDVPGNPKYFARLSASVSNNYLGLWQIIEGARTLAGKLITITFWAKGANPGGGSFTVNGGFDYGTGGAPSDNDFSQVKEAYSVSNDWQKFSFTFTIPSLAGATLGTDGNDGFNVVIANTDTDSSTDAWQLDIAHVSLVIGDATQEADPFSPRHISLEKMLCQRYYEILVEGRNTSYPYIVSGAEVNATTFVSGKIPYKVTKRAVPSIGIFGNVLMLIGGTATSADVNYVTENDWVFRVEGTGFTAGLASIARFDANGGYIAADAEL